MKQGIEAFKAAVKAYLDEQAERDEMFARHYADPNKTLDNCAYANGYYSKENSLILSATVDGMRIETVLAATPVIGSRVPESLSPPPLF